MLYVCSLARLSETVTATGARHLVTLIGAGTAVSRPTMIDERNHLFLAFDDIVEPVPGLMAPAELHVERLIAFFRAWDRQAPMVVHCFAGISRSTAGAYIAACALTPERDEADIAAALRRVAPSATPNARLVALADRALGRDGRMVEAIKAIGRGADAFEGAPFLMPIG